MTMLLAENEVRPLAERFDQKAANYERVGLEALQALLLTTEGAEPFTLTALTVPDYRKRKCPFKDDILKLARVNGMINWDYTNAVNRQRAREGVAPNFVALPRRWGTPLAKTPFVSHVTKDGRHKLYVRFRAMRLLGVEYFHLDGRPIPTELADPWINKPEPNERQGVEQEVYERDYTVTNILSVVVNKRGYVLTL